MKFEKHNIRRYGVSPEEYDSCRDLLWQSNQYFLKLVVTVSFLLTFILLYLSLSLAVLYPLRYLYLCFAALLLLDLILVYTLTPTQTHLRTLVYTTIILLFSFGIALPLSPLHLRAVAFPILLVMLPLLFIDDMLVMSAVSIGSSLVFIILVHCFNDDVSARLDTVNATLFCTISLITHFSLSGRQISSLSYGQINGSVLSDYEESKRKLKYQTERDILTGLYNRFHFIDQADRQLTTGQAGATLSVLGVLNLNNFKQINDLYGHVTGDKIIVAVAETLQRQLREHDIVGRLGSDEFSFLLTNIKQVSAVDHVVWRMLDAIDGIGEMRGIPFRSSIGVAVSDENSRTFDALYKKASAALLRAKSSQKSQFCFYSDDPTASDTDSPSQKP